MGIDLRDKKILYELDKNARVSYSEIAKKIKLSKNAVINRIKEMEKQQIILGYNTLININELGFTTYDVYLKFKDTTLEKEKEIIDSLIKNKEVWFVGKCEGDINLALLISTKTPEEFDKIWNNIYSKIKHHIEVVRIAILLEYHHFGRKYLLEDKKERAIAIVGKRSNQEVPVKDLKILKILSQNARISLLDMSEKLKLTPKAVHYRIEKLKKQNIILGYKANINFSKLGYEYYKVMIELNDLEIIPKLYDWILSNPNAVYYDKFIGGHDFEFDLELASFNLFVKFIEELKAKFKGTIKQYSFLRPTIIYKSNYF